MFAVLAVQLALIGVHVTPDEKGPVTVNEINALIHVHAAVEQHWNTDDIIIMGDLNADCRYVKEHELPHLLLRKDPRFIWLIDDDVDTTVSSTDCAYDR